MQGAVAAAAAATAARSAGPSFSAHTPVDHPTTCSSLGAKEEMGTSPASAPQSPLEKGTQEGQWNFQTYLVNENIGPPAL